MAGKIKGKSVSYNGQTSKAMVRAWAAAGVCEWQVIFSGVSRSYSITLQARHCFDLFIAEVCGHMAPCTVSRSVTLDGDNDETAAAAAMEGAVTTATASTSEVVVVADEGEEEVAGQEAADDDDNDDGFAPVTVAHGTFGNRQGLSLEANGPFTHSFEW